MHYNGKMFPNCEVIRSIFRNSHINAAYCRGKKGFTSDSDASKTRSRSASDIADAKQPDKYIQPASTDVSRWFSPHSIHSEAFCAKESRRGGRAAEPLAKVRE